MFKKVFPFICFPLFSSVKNIKAKQELIQLPMGRLKHFGYEQRLCLHSYFLGVCLVDSQQIQWNASMENTQLIFHL